MTRVDLHVHTPYCGHASGSVEETVQHAIKQELQIPVIGNGDVRSVADIGAIKQRTGCDAVMIGRAAVDNPWIFSRLDRENISLYEVQKTVLNHFEKMLSFYGERGVITFRKYLKAYLSPYPLPRQVLLSILKSKDPKFIENFLMTDLQLYAEES